MTILRILSWITFGLIIGALARFLMPGRQEMSLIMTMALGIIGSFAGGAIAVAIFPSSGGSFQPGGWISSIVGALIVLFAYSQVVAKK